MTDTDKLPKAEEVLKRILSRSIYSNKLASIEAMHEYARQVLDVVAERANVIYTGEPIQYAEVDKQSILRFKEMLK